MDAGQVRGSVSDLRLPQGSMRYLILAVVILAVISGEVGYSYLEGLNSKHPGSATNPGSTGSRGCVPTGGSRYLEATALINYGNGTSRWYNNTRVPSQWNFYNLTLLVANCHVDAEYYPIYKANYIIAISGVTNKDPVDWTLWIYCGKDQAWSISQVGADLIQLENGGIYAWYYQDTSGAWQPPVAGAKTIALCSQ
jgi:hypothetical protein